MVVEIYLPPMMFILPCSYYSLIEVIYEAFTLSAFLMLLIQFVASTASSQTAESALERKDKARLPIPLCCWRFRPTKPYFMYTLKWSVLQYTIVRPGVSLSSSIPSIINFAPQLLPLPALLRSTTVSCVRGHFRHIMQVYI